MLAKGSVVVDPGWCEIGLTPLWKGLLVEEEEEEAASLAAPQAKPTSPKKAQSTPIRPNESHIE